MDDPHSSSGRNKLYRAAGWSVVVTRIKQLHGTNQGKCPVHLWVFGRSWLVLQTFLHSVMHWCSLTLNSVCSSVLRCIKRILRCLKGSRGNGGKEESNNAGDGAGRHAVWGETETLGLLSMEKRRLEVTSLLSASPGGDAGLCSWAPMARWEQHKAVLEEGKTRHWETFLCQKGGQTLVQAS